MIVSFPLLVLDSCAFFMQNSDLSMEKEMEVKNS